MQTYIYIYVYVYMTYFVSLVSFGMIYVMF